MFSSTLQESFMSHSYIYVGFAIYSAVMAAFLLLSPEKYFAVGKWFSFDTKAVLENGFTRGLVVKFLVRNLPSFALLGYLVVTAFVPTVLCYAATLVFLTLVARIKLGKNFMFKILEV